MLLGGCYLENGDFGGFRAVINSKQVKERVFGCTWYVVSVLSKCNFVECEVEVNWDGISGVST